MYVESFMRDFHLIAIRTLSNLSPQPPPRIIVLIILFVAIITTIMTIHRVYKLGSSQYNMYDCILYIIAQIEFPGEAGASGER